MKPETPKQLILNNITPTKRSPENCPDCAFFHNPALCQKFTCEITDSNRAKLVAVYWKPCAVDAFGNPEFSDTFIDYANKTAFKKTREISEQIIMETFVQQNTK